MKFSCYELCKCKFNFAFQTHPFYCKTVVLKQTGFVKRGKLVVVALPVVKPLYVSLFGGKKIVITACLGVYR